MQIQVKIKKLDSGVEIPEYQTDFSSGVDLRASADYYLPVNKENHQWSDGAIGTLVQTGLSIQIPQGFEAQIRPRSGLALKKGLTVLNTPGTIDADYRGEICVIMINHGSEDVLIEAGERIAQMVFMPIVRASFVEVEELDETTRGDGGFGSTGTK